MAREKKPEDKKAKRGERRRDRRSYIVSAELDDGTLLETLYRPEERQTRLLVARGDRTWETASFEHAGVRLLPFSPGNNLLTHQVVLLPSDIEPHTSQVELLQEVRAFIHRYVDVSDAFEELVAHYVLLTWRYEDFNELPYLRVKGDYGTGKSRFLQTVGSISYKPIFASGASTVSPLFRILDAVRGTLVIDEGDFRFSDETAEVIKILNNGNARGFPVLRTEVTPSKEFNPRAFYVFGPKLVATRSRFRDTALESRCITEDLSHRKLRSDIPLNLPESFHSEALQLRNKLLDYRLTVKGREDHGLELSRSLPPRVAQILAPLSATMERQGARRRLSELAAKLSGELALERSFQVVADVLQVTKELREEEETLALSAIAKRFSAKHGEEFDQKITPRWVGTILRRECSLRPRKSHGNFIIPLEEYPKLDRLFEEYGLVEDGDVGEEEEEVSDQGEQSEKGEAFEEEGE